MTDNDKYKPQVTDTDRYYSNIYGINNKSPKLLPQEKILKKSKLVPLYTAYISRKVLYKYIHCMPEKKFVDNLCWGGIVEDHLFDQSSYMEHRHCESQG